MQPGKVAKTYNKRKNGKGKQMENENRQNAERLAKAIKRLANNPENLGNFENYLAAHFDKWLATWVTTPAGMASEFEMFAEM